MSKFRPTGKFKLIDPKEFDLNKYSSNSLEGCVLEFDLEYRKELRELRNDCPLALDEIEIKEKMLSKYQVMIAVLHNVEFNTQKVEAEKNGE